MQGQHSCLLSQNLTSAQCMDDDVQQGNASHLAWKYTSCRPDGRGNSIIAEWYSMKLELYVDKVRRTHMSMYGYTHVRYCSAYIAGFAMLSSHRTLWNFQLRRRLAFVRCHFNLCDYTLQCRPSYDAFRDWVLWVHVTYPLTPWPWTCAAIYAYHLNSV